MFMKMSSGGEEEGVEAAPTEATVAVAGTSAVGTATGATPGEAVEGAVEDAIEGVGETASAAPVAVPAPPPPRPVASAYDSGKTVVLLIVHDGGIDDKLVQQASSQLDSDPERGLLRRAGQADRRLRGDHPRRRRQPRAGSGRDAAEEAQRRHPAGQRRSTASRHPQSVVQAVRDAAYDGPEAHLPPELSRPMSAETPYPGHLRPVPDSGGSAAPAMPGPGEGGTLGLTPPLHRGHSRGFITDVLVELGYASAETVQTAVEESRTAGLPAGGDAARPTARSAPISSRGRPPSATGSITSTSPPTRWTWPRRRSSR